MEQAKNTHQFIAPAVPAVVHINYNAKSTEPMILEDIGLLQDTIVEIPTASLYPDNNVTDKTMYEKVSKTN